MWDHRRWCLHYQTTNTADENRPGRSIHRRGDVNLMQVLFSLPGSYRQAANKMISKKWQISLCLNIVSTQLNKFSSLLDILLTQILPPISLVYTWQVLIINKTIQNTPPVWKIQIKTHDPNALRLGIQSGCVQTVTSQERFSILLMLYPEAFHTDTTGRCFLQTGLGHSQPLANLI